MTVNLREALNEAEWSWLTGHLERQAVIVISQDLELVHVGERVANDDVDLVQRWIEDGKLTKPSPVQLESWNANPSKRFLTLIVAPYVLIQEMPH
jgi:hypothetical protein